MAHNPFSRKEGDKAKRMLVPVKGAPADDEAIRLAFTYAVAKKGKGRNTAVDVVYVVEVPHALPLDAHAEPGHEEGRDQAEPADQRQHPPRRQRPTSRQRVAAMRAVGRHWGILLDLHRR